MTRNMASDLRKRGADETVGVSPYVTSPGRSRNMAAIRRTDTKPEIAIRSALHRRGHRFRKDLRLNLGDVRPRPDVVFTRRKVAVFIDGCFWHACPEHSAPPRQNTGYWGPKLQGNVDRDRRYDEALITHGWLVVRAWEHEAADEVVRRVEAALSQRMTWARSVTEERACVPPASTRGTVLRHHSGSDATATSATKPLITLSASDVSTLATATPITVTPVSEPTVCVMVSVPLPLKPS